MNRVVTCAAVSVVLAASAVVASATPAQAAPLKARALDVARAQVNDPYRRGSAGPYRFDCSGLTQYSYKKVGKRLPRTAAAQYNATRHVSARNRQPGDLVFFGSPVHHVGVYAGNGKIYNANTGSYRGRKVVLAPISEYGGPVRYGQVR